MPDRKVSELTELLANDLNPNTDWLLVSDMSALTSKKMKPLELMRSTVLNQSSVYDFTTGQLSPWIAFTRASAAWYRDSIGAIANAAMNVPRFHYDPVTRTPRGLLIEEAATNQFMWSEDLDNAAWSKARTSVPVANGYDTLDKLVENSEGSTHNISQSSSVVSGSTYCFSVLAKADGRNFIILSIPSATLGGIGAKRSWFNLVAGTLGQGHEYAEEFIEDMGNGVYRCSIIFTALATLTGTNPFVEMAEANGGANYVGDGSSGVFLGGMSLTELPIITSPILTGASAVARAEDFAFINNPAVLTDQCWVVKGRTPRRGAADASNRVAFSVDDNSNNNRRLIRYDTDGTLRAVAVAGGVSQCNISLGVVNPDTDFSLAVRWAENNFAASINGGAVQTDLSGANPYGMKTARIGRGFSGQGWNSTIKYIETRRVANDSELQALSV